MQLQNSIRKMDYTEDSTRNCITVASNFMKEIVIDKSNNSADTLRSALNGCSPTLFPHEALSNSLKNL